MLAIISANCWFAIMLFVFLVAFLFVLLSAHTTPRNPLNSDEAESTLRHDELRIVWTCHSSPYIEGQSFDETKCGKVFDTVEAIDDWFSGICTTQCPACGMALTQRHDAPVRALDY